MMNTYYATRKGVRKLIEAPDIYQAFEIARQRFNAPPHASGICVTATPETQAAG